MNVHMKFHMNPVNNSKNKTNINLVVVLEEKSVNQQSHQQILYFLEFMIVFSFYHVLYVKYS